MLSKDVAGPLNSSIHHSDDAIKKKRCDSCFTFVKHFCHTVVQFPNNCSHCSNISDTQISSSPVFLAQLSLTMME